MTESETKMDYEVLKDNLDSLSEFILDEEKIVTYSYLSKKLCIHVNESKFLLRVFLENIRKSNPGLTLNVNYIICGIGANNRARVCVVPEKDIEQMRRSFTTVNFVHIYSISKSLVDDAALSATKNFEDINMLIGFINNNSCAKYSAKEMRDIKQNSQDLEKIIKQNSKIDSEYHIKKVPSNKISNILALEKPNEDENVNRDLNNVPEKTIKHENSNKTTKEESSPKNCILSTKSSVRSQKGIANYFNKQNGLAAKETLAVKSDMNINKIKIEQPCGNSDKQKVSNKNVLLASDNMKNTNLAVKSLQTSSIKNNARVDNKRKRILKVSDSESEEELKQATNDGKESVDSDDEIPPTPANKIIKITTGIKNSKKRKIVDKTYTDEDGYILTKKEEVYESGSDSENSHEAKEITVQNNISKNDSSTIKIEKEVTKNNRSKSKKKLSSPQKGKQATLMNFFKKKP